MNQPAPPRQTRSKDTLERIVAATAALLEERDFANISVVQIAERAGVAPGLLYSRFKKKDDLLPYILKRYLRSHLDRFRAATEASDVTDLPGAVAFLIDHLAEDFATHRGMVRATGARHLSGVHPLDEEEAALYQERQAALQGWISRFLPDPPSAELDEAARFVVQTISTTAQIFFLFDAGQTPLERDETFGHLRRSMTAYLNSIKEGSA